MTHFGKKSAEFRGTHSGEKVQTEFLDDVFPRMMEPRQSFAIPPTCVIPKTPRFRQRGEGSRVQQQRGRGMFIRHRQTEAGVLQTVQLRHTQDPSLG
jgi:hypothetical protein